MAKRTIWVMLVILLVALSAYPVLPAAAQVGAPDPNQGVAFDQKLNNQVPLDAVFRDETGSQVTLGSFFRSKPVLLVFAYYNCQDLCTLVLANLASMAKTLGLGLGSQYEILTVSIDSRETPAMAAAKKAVTMKQVDQPGAASGWHFLTGDEASIQRLTQAVGYHYQYHAETDQFAHPTGLVILTPAGTVSRYLFGIDFSKTDVRLGLVEASQEKIGSPIDQLLLLCYHYDPVMGRYNLLINRVLQIAGVGTASALAVLILFYLRRERRVGGPSGPDRPAGAL